MRHFQSVFCQKRLSFPLFFRHQMQLFRFRIELGPQGCDLGFQGLALALLLAEPAIRLMPACLLGGLLLGVLDCPGTAG
jgi:hypothetical protein